MALAETGAVRLRARIARRRRLRDERVTEAAVPGMRRDRGVVLPAGPEVRVERVDVDVARPLVAHGRGRRPRAVDRLAAVEQPAEEPLVGSAVRPVPVDLEPRKLAAPVRDVELDAALLVGPRREAAHRQVPLPLLQRPVRPVGRLAAGDEERQRRAVVAAAAVPERPPVVRVLAALPAARVVHLEPRLNGRRLRLVGDPVDRAPDEHVAAQARRRRVLDEGDPARVDLERRVPDAEVAEDGAAGAPRQAERERTDGGGDSSLQHSPQRRADERKKL